MVCPKCLSNKITYIGTSPNGGTLIAGEEFECGIECYSNGAITAYICNACNCDFYIEEEDEND